MRVKDAGNDAHPRPNFSEWAVLRFGSRPLRADVADTLARSHINQRIPSRETSSVQRYR